MASIAELERQLDALRRHQESLEAERGRADAHSTLFCDEALAAWIAEHCRNDPPYTRAQNYLSQVSHVSRGKPVYWQLWMLKVPYGYPFPDDVRAPVYMLGSLARMNHKWLAMRVYERFVRFKKLTLLTFKDAVKVGEIVTDRIRVKYRKVNQSSHRGFELDIRATALCPSEQFRNGCREVVVNGEAVELTRHQINTLSKLSETLERAERLEGLALKLAA